MNPCNRQRPVMLVCEPCNAASNHPRVHHYAMLHSFGISYDVDDVVEKCRLRTDKQRVY